MGSDDQVTNLFIKNKTQGCFFNSMLLNRVEIFALQTQIKTGQLEKHHTLDLSSTR
jgi:hypothetical protein